MQHDNFGRIVKGTHWRKPKQHWNHDWLHPRYVTECVSTGDIARECECTDANVLYWLKKHGIPRRSVSEARSLKHWGVSGESNPMHGKTGALNPRFVDGSSPERQRLYVQAIGKEFLREMMKRDCYRCRRCNAAKNGAKSLHVHHIKAWTGNPDLRFEASNVVTLCKPCHDWVHSRANSRREFVA